MISANGAFKVIIVFLYLFLPMLCARLQKICTVCRARLKEYIILGEYLNLHRRDQSHFNPCKKFLTIVEIFLSLSYRLTKSNIFHNRKTIKNTLQKRGIICSFFNFYVCLQCDCHLFCLVNNTC